MPNLLKKIFKKYSEEEYYTNLFIRNPVWNTETPNREEFLRWQIIEEFLKQIAISDHQSKPQILDIGCGRGWLSNLLSSYGYVTGIEPVKAVVKYAKKLFPTLNIRIGTVETLLKEGKSGFYDIVVCSEVIEHIPDDKKEQFLLQTKRLLKTNGVFIITTPRKDAENEWKKYSDPNQPIEDWLSEQTLAQLLSKASFKFNEQSVKRLSISPSTNVPEIEIYQLWLVQNT